MARSVSVPCGAAHVEYATFESDDDDGDSFDYALSDFKAALRKAFPSVTSCDEWLGRGNSEDHAVMSNGFAYFGVSEYCGLVAMWVVPIDDDYATSTGLRDKWVDSIGPKFAKIAGECFGQALIKQGTFSNGEAIFQPADGNQKGDMGLGFTSKEGWL